MTPDETMFETRKEATDHRHELRNEVTRQLAIMQKRLEEKDHDCPYRDDVLLTKQAVTTMTNSLEKIEEMVGETKTKVDEIGDRKVDRWVFVWVIGAICFLGLMGFSFIYGQINDVKTALGWYEIKLPTN